MADTEDSRERRNAYMRAWNAANRQKVNAQKRAWNAANREEKKTRDRAYYEAHREEIAKTNRKWREANRKKANQIRRKSSDIWAAKYPERAAYSNHKQNARKRRIPFLLTFSEWWTIWQDSDRWELRGARRGQYVMARFGDQGAYERCNVHICTHTENIQQARWREIRQGGKVTGHKS